MKYSVNWISKRWALPAIKILIFNNFLFKSICYYLNQKNQISIINKDGYNKLMHLYTKCVRILSIQSDHLSLSNNISKHGGQKLKYLQTLSIHL